MLKRDFFSMCVLAVTTLPAFSQTYSTTAYVDEIQNFGYNSTTISNTYGTAGSASASAEIPPVLLYPSILPTITGSASATTLAGGNNHSQPHFMSQMTGLIRVGPSVDEIRIVFHLDAHYSLSVPPRFNTALSAGVATNFRETPELFNGYPQGFPNGPTFGASTQWWFVGIESSGGEATSADINRLFHYNAEYGGFIFNASMWGAADSFAGGSYLESGAGTATIDVTMYLAGITLVDGTPIPDGEISISSFSPAPEPSAVLLISVSTFGLLHLARRRIRNCCPPSQVVNLR
jgi:hypothetical protein